MNADKITVDAATVILTPVPRRKTKFRELMEWIKDEKKVSWSQLATQSGLFVRAAITQQINKQEPNPGFEMIHGIARVAKISEQMIIDACLGRDFKAGRDLEDKALKEVLRKFQMLDPDYRNESLNKTIALLSEMIDEALDKQRGG